MNNDPNDNIEISGSGQPIYRYELPQNKEDRPAVPIDDATAEKIDAHVAAHYGKVDFVWHEIVSTSDDDERLIHLHLHADEIATLLRLQFRGNARKDELLHRIK